MALTPGLYPHTVRIEAVTARNERGKATQYGEPQTPRASVIPERKVLYAGAGEEVVSRGRAICKGPLSVAKDSVITFPSEFGFEERLRVIDARPHTDPLLRKVDSVEVFV